jgi:hypothetical protein
MNPEGLSDVLFEEIHASMTHIRQTAKMTESEHDFEEKREEEKQVLYIAANSLETISVMKLTAEHFDKIRHLCKQFYEGTNWMVRNSFLKISL